VHCRAFLSAKGLDATDIHKEMFPVYGGKFDFRLFGPQMNHLGCKRFAGVEQVETEVQKWLRQTVKRLLSCGFRRIGKEMGQVYQCWWRICREIIFFSGSNIIRFTFYIHF
jgi:hypothetical protein